MRGVSLKLELKATREKSFMYGNMLISIQVVTTRSRSFNGCSIVRALKVNSSWTTWEAENIEIKVKIEFELIIKIKTKQNRFQYSDFQKDIVLHRWLSLFLVQSLPCTRMWGNSSSSNETLKAYR